MSGMIEFTQPNTGGLMSTLSDVREYRFSDPDLYLFASNLYSFLNRDLTEMATFGVTEEKLEVFRDYLDDFEQIAPDGSIRADVQEYTLQKNNLKEELLEAIRNMALRVELKWGIASSNYRRLNLSTLTRLSDSELLFAARTVHTRSNDWISDLTDYGLTAEVLTSFNSLIQNFELSLNEQSDAIADRDIKRVERITRGNELYRLVANYTNIGKRVYEKSNPAKYNDYIIYSSSAGTILEPTDLMYNIPTKVLSWAPVVNSTSYQAEYSTDGTNWDEIFTGYDTSFTYPFGIEQVVYFKVKARNNNGFGPYSSVKEVIYDNNMATPHRLAYNYTNSTITWDAIANANFYELVYRQANSNSDWINIYNGPNNEAQFNFPDGSWEMKIRAANADQGSTWSPIRIVSLPGGDSSNNG